MKEVQSFLNNLLKKNDRVVIATSGGPDSMCLLHIVLSMQKEKNLEIICAHVNHNVRSESKKELEFVKKYCEENNIIFTSMKIDKYHNNKFTESDAREKRYAFFFEVMEKFKANYLMTAHHGDDLIETILMRIVRGSNLKGYLGIPVISKKDNYKIVRPLLYTKKEDIIKYLEDNKIKYVIDKSNENEEYTRNRYRKNIIPFLKREDANVNLKFLKFSEELINYNEYINKIIDKVIAKIYKNGKIDINLLIKEDVFIQKKIIERVIEEIQKEDLFNISDKQMQEILKLIKNKGNKNINLANGFIARVSYQYLIIEKGKEIDNYEYIFKDKIEILNKYKIEKINKIENKSNNIIRILSSEVKLPLIIRNYRSGDRMDVKNLLGSKKVSDIFIDSKIDKEIRKEYPIVCDSENRIIWLPGVKKSIFDKEKEEKYDIILKYTEE